MNKDCLAYKLKEYVSSGILPMHMPGHKRKVPKAIEEMMRKVFKTETGIRYLKSLFLDR